MLMPRHMLHLVNERKKQEEWFGPGRYCFPIERDEDTMAPTQETVNMTAATPPQVLYQMAWDMEGYVYEALGRDSILEHAVLLRLNQEAAFIE